MLRSLPDECVDLIYLDPPFNSNQFYVAAFGDKGMVQAQLRDIWRWTTGTERTFNELPHGRLLDCINGVRLLTGPTAPMAAYILYMGVRLQEMRRVLKNTGSIYLHCDPHANAYLRILMNAIFGEKQFRNEIVWCYTGPGSPRMRQFNRKHDTIFWYANGKKWTFNKDDVRIPHKDGGPHAGGFKGGSTKPDDPHYGKQGKIPETWWTDIAIASRSSTQYLGYPTQKPLALLERIIKASSNEGDLVMDPFCGCGTAADAAASIERKYLGIDISGIAVRVMQQRLESRGDAAAPVVYGLEWDDHEWRDFERRALMPRDDAEDNIPGWAWAEDKVAALLNAVPNQRKTGDGGIDARYFGAMDIVRKEGIIIPIQVKMNSKPTALGRPDMDRLLGTQTALNNRGLHAPMSIMVSLYEPPDALRVFAAQQGRVTLTTSGVGAVDYPVMQVLSVEEMLLHGDRPKLPPVDPRSLVGDTQDRMIGV